MHKIQYNSIDTMLCLHTFKILILYLNSCCEEMNNGNTCYTPLLESRSPPPEFWVGPTQ